MGDGSSFLIDYVPKKLGRRLNSMLYFTLLDNNLRATKELWHKKGVGFSDSGDIKIIVDSMNRVYRTESNIKNAKSLIRFTNRNTKISEKDMPRTLRLGIPLFFRIVGIAEDREHNMHELEEYTRLRENILTKKHGYYGVPNPYHSQICAINENRYDETILALTNQLKGLSLAKSLLSDNSLLESDFDLCLSSDEKKNKRAHKRHIRLLNKISRRKDKLQKLAQNNIDELQLKIGAYSRFKETSRVARLRKRF